VDQKDQDVPRFEAKPMFEPPKDFTFARDVSAFLSSGDPGLNYLSQTTSPADAAPPEPTKEPPIAALPFSLTPESSKSSFLAAASLTQCTPARRSSHISESPHAAKE
jgi:hypothetical protein